MLYVIPVLIIIFIAVIFIRAISFRPEKKKYNTSSALNEKTYKKPRKPENYDDFLQAFPEIFPGLYKSCVIFRVPGKSLVIKIEGKNSEKSALLSVSFNNDGIFNSLLAASESMISGGFVPENNIYITVFGEDAPDSEAEDALKKLFEERHIKPDFILCEGGKLSGEIMAADGKACAFIGTADIREDKKAKGYYPVPLLDMFDKLGRNFKFSDRIVLANLWCFGGLLEFTLAKAGEAYKSYAELKGYRTGRVSPAGGGYWELICSAAESAFEGAVCAACPEKENGKAVFLAGLFRNVYRFSPDADFEKCAAFYEHILKQL